MYLVVFSEYLIQEHGPDSSAMSCSSVENNPKSLRISDGPQGDRQWQSGDRAASLPSGQLEAGRGPQKKPQVRSRDQKGSEGLDVQGKLGARSVTPSSRRSPFPGKLQEEKGMNPGSGVRRNASSAGRLQGVSSGLFSGSPGRKESKTPEVNLPSRKKRPKSLEFTISSGGEPFNPETLLLQEKIRSENPDSGATSSEVATLDIGATMALEKCSRNPEHSMILERGAFRNTVSHVSLAREERTWEHPESRAPLEKHGTEDPETPETLGEVVGGVLHKPSNSEVPLSSSKKGPQNPEDLASLGMVTYAGIPPQTSFYPHCTYVTGSLGDPQGPQPFENLM